MINPTSRAAGNAGFWTPVDKPDPEVLPGVKGWRVLVRPYPAQEKTKGGIIIPDTSKDYQDLLRCVGKVVKMGDLCYKRPEIFFGDYDPWCQVGDWVLLPKYAGTKIQYKGVRYIMCNDDEIMATVTGPEDIVDEYVAYT